MSRLFAHSRLVRALEAEEDTPPAAVEADNANSAETDLVEVAEGEAETTAADASVDEAVEAVASLESFCVALESAAQNGGLDRAGAQVMNIGLGHIYARMGFSTAGSKPAVSMESFGQNSSRVGATTLALEDVKSKIADIWKAIVAAIKRAIEWVKGHFNKIFGAAEKLQKRAKALAEKAKGYTGATQKESSFDNERIAKAFTIKGVMSASISSDLVAVKTIAEAVFTKVAEFNASAAQTALDELNSEATNVSDIKTVGFTNGIYKKVDDPAAIGFGAPPDGMTFYRSDELPGNKAAIATVTAGPAIGEAAVIAGSRKTFSVSSFDPKAKEVSNTTVKTLQPPEAGKIADEIATLMTEVINYKAKVDKMAGLKNKLAAAADKVGKSATTEENKEKAAWYAAMQKITTNTVSDMDRAPAAMAAYLVNTGKAALDYAEESLKQYTTK